jgi:hypothetical protein
MDSCVILQHVRSKQMYHENVFFQHICKRYDKISNDIIIVPTLTLDKIPMRLFLLAPLLIFFSCWQPRQKETPETQDSLSQDTTNVQGAIKKNYSPPDTDTLVSEKEILIRHEPYKLTIIAYCHNDSAVVNDVWFRNGSGEGVRKELHFSHNYSNRVILTNGGNLIFDKLISKDAFTGPLDQEYLKQAMLYDIQYNFAQASRLYFKATFVVPNTTRAEEIAFSLSYQPDADGQFAVGWAKPDWAVNDDLNNDLNDELKLYWLRYHGNDPAERIGFISLSDNYLLSDHPDSLAIPDLYPDEGNALVEDKEYFTLESTYRKKFLTKTKISETDQVFIYNYYRDTLVSFPVKNLKVVACLSVYASEDNSPYSQGDYMIGFEIDKNVLTNLGEYYSETFVYVGKENPFVQGKLRNIAWKKNEPADFPANTMNSKNAIILQSYEKGDTYTYKTSELHYFIQDYLRNNDVSARRVLAVDSQTKETVRDQFYYDSEGSGLAPLNNQWTGELFKDKPAVIFGMEYVSFGCPFIAFLDKSEWNVGINCDNRH